MAPTVAELVNRNDQASSLHQPLLTFQENAEVGIGPPRIAIISCADPRVTPEKYFNLGPMEAVVLRNVGGHPQSCWKDIAALDTFEIEFFKNSGFEQIIVVHHTGTHHTLLLLVLYLNHSDYETDCGTLFFTNEMVRGGLQKQYPENKEIAGVDFGAVSTRCVLVAEFLNPC